MIEDIPANECTTERKEGFMDVRAPFAAASQAAELMQPTDRPSHNPSQGPQAAAVLGVFQPAEKLLQNPPFCRRRQQAMAQQGGPAITQLLPGELWTDIEPLPPGHAARPKGGRPPGQERDCLRGIIFIIFVLRSGIPWQLLPSEALGASGSTCRRRLHEWTEAGLWPQVHHRLVSCLGKLDAVDRSADLIDSASVRALFWGRIRGQVPLIAGKTAANGT